MFLGHFTMPQGKNASMNCFEKFWGVKIFYSDIKNTKGQLIYNRAASTLTYFRPMFPS